MHKYPVIATLCDGLSSGNHNGVVSTTTKGMKVHSADEMMR